MVLIAVILEMAGPEDKQRLVTLNLSRAHKARISVLVNPLMRS